MREIIPSGRCEATKIVVRHTKANCPRILTGNKPGKVSFVYSTV
jgi:hypothetical protein